VKGVKRHRPAKSCLTSCMSQMITSSDKLRVTPRNRAAGLGKRELESVRSHKMENICSRKKSALKYCKTYAVLFTEFSLQHPQL
jgi:hypothetical protein